MIASWSAKAVCVAGDRLITWTSKPAWFASLAPLSKKLVAVLKTPVMSGGVQPITISCSKRSPPSSSSPPHDAATKTAASVAAKRASRRLLPIMFPPPRRSTVRSDPSSPPPLGDSPGGVAAVDDQLRPRHVRGLLARYEYDRRSNLLGRTEPARRARRREPVLVGGRIGSGLDRRLHERRACRARTDADGADPVLGMVDGDRSRQHQQPGLGDVVGRLAGDGDDPRL